MLSSHSDCIHEVWLKQVVVLVKFKTLMEQCCVHLVGKAHQPHCLIFYLGDQCFVVIGLCSNQLGQEIFTIGFSNSFRLIVKDISKIIMILLLSSSDFDEW